MERDYNTTRPDMRIREYGRNVQNLVDYALTIDDKDKRTKLAYIIVSVMQQVNPTDNINDAYYKKLWNHLYAISEYKLEIEYPYEVEKIEDKNLGAVEFEYSDNVIMYRFYGRNTELLLKNISLMEEGSTRTKLLMVVANQMKEMYINWNKRIVSDDLIDMHIQRITDDVLRLPEGEELTSANDILKKLNSTLATKKSTFKGKPKQSSRQASKSNGKRPKKAYSKGSYSKSKRPSKPRGKY